MSKQVALVLDPDEDQTDDDDALSLLCCGLIEILCNAHRLSRGEAKKWVAEEIDKLHPFVAFPPVPRFH